MKTINTLLASLTLKEKLSIHIQKRVYGGNHTGVDPEISSFNGSSSITKS